MPGHKGQHFVGCEAYDITEVAGADSLYEADGIIAESEANATSLLEQQELCIRQKVPVNASVQCFILQ